MRKFTLFRSIIPVGLASLLGFSLAAGQTQPPERIPVWGELFVGSEMEEYLRLLQLTGRAPLLPWSVRRFGPVEVRALATSETDHPWSSRYDLAGDTVGAAAALVRPSLSGSFNSAFPQGSGDGPVWAGKGVTGSLQTGFAYRYKALSVVFAPIVFAAQNAEFALMPNGSTADSTFRDPRYPGTIDLPQRFGDAAYSGVDPGQSTVRLDFLGAAVGVSTANAQWGPAREYPLILGNNAAGIPHMFLGTSTPANIWIGSLHGRLLWGVLQQSEYSPMEQAHTRRLMTGMVASFLPRGIDGLEVGLGRFYHSSWPVGGIGPGIFTKPFESFLKVNVSGADLLVENQLASVFARWALTPAGFEVYGEFGREDHNYNLRDFLLEPDHDSAYLIGFQRVWQRGGTRLWALRGEVVNAEVSHLAEVRSQVPFYLHGLLRQGHTQRGQLLGSPAVYGGAGAKLSVDHYHEGGRLTFFGERTLRNVPTTGANATHLDVVLSSGLEWLSFHGPLEVTAGMAGALNLNRDFQGDAFNLNATLRLKAGL